MAIAETTIWWHTLAYSFRFAPFVGKHSRVAPVLIVNLLNDDVSVLRLLFQDSHQRVREFPDDLVLLFAGCSARDLKIDVGHD